MLFRLALVFFFLSGDALAADATQAQSNRPVRPPELLALIKRADTVKVYDAREKNSETLVYSSSDPQDLTGLNAAITIEPPKGWFRCACMASLVIRLFRESKELGSFDVFEGLTIRFPSWFSDARIRDKEKWLQWFDARRITLLRQEVEQQETVVRESRAAEKRWIRAMPVSLRPIWSKVVRDMSPGRNIDNQALVLALAKEFPEPKKRIRALLFWYGSGAGPWSGFPTYEQVALEMLLEYSTPELLAAIQDAPLNDPEVEGTARLFAGWDFSARRPEDIALIPSELKRVLLEHALKSSDEDKLGRAHKAFDQN